MALGRTSTAVYYWTISDNGRCRTFGKSLSDAQHTAHGEEFKVILTVKMETRHPTVGPFVCEFLASVIIAEL